MIISEKQIQKLMSICEDYVNNLHDQNNLYLSRKAESIEKFLNSIKNQQSEELKEIK